MIVRGRDYSLLDLPAVQARLQEPPDQQSTHPESGTSRSLFDCLDVPLTAPGPVVRMIIATHPASSSPPPIGVMRNGTVYEQFFTTVPQGAFTPADVLDLYLYRGSFETVLADKDDEQDPDRWCSHTPCGQEVWKILSQWVWNLRLELGQKLSPTSMRMTEFAPAHAGEPVQELLSLFRLLSLPSPYCTDPLNGHVLRIREDFQVPLSLYNLMERSAVLLVIHSTRKSADPKGTAPYASCTLHASVTAVPALFANSVKNRGPLSNHDGSVP